MKIYLIKGYGIDVVENQTETLAIICQTPEEVEKQMGFIIEEAHQWATAGWDFPIDYTEKLVRRRGLIIGYSMSVKYDLTDPKQKEEWLVNPTLSFAYISPDDFNYTEKSKGYLEYKGFKTAHVVSVSVKEINLTEE